MLSCKDATNSLSDHIDAELSFFDRISMRLHFLVCSDCKRAAANMRSLVASMHGRPPAPDAVLGDGVSEDYVDRVMQALDKQALKKRADNTEH